MDELNNDIEELSRELERLRAERRTGEIEQARLGRGWSGYDSFWTRSGNEGTRWNHSATCPSSRPA